MNDKSVTKKKIIWIVNQYVSPYIPNSRQAILARLLEERGYYVYVICGSFQYYNSKNLIEKGKLFFKIRRVDVKYIVVKTVDYSSQIKRVIASLQMQYILWHLRKVLPKPNVIVSDFAGLFGNGFFNWKKKYDTRVVFDILDLWPEEFIEQGYIRKNSLIAKLLYHMEHESYRKADGIIFSFEGGKKYISDKKWDIASGGDVNIEDIGYLNNGIDKKWINTCKKDYKYDDKDLETDKFKAIYVGNIGRPNAIEQLVEAAEILAGNKEDNIIILVYGDGSERKKLENKANKKGLSNIKFKGILPVEYAVNVIGRCDVALRMFHKTSILKYGLSNNKFFLYCAAGCPIISSVRTGYDITEEQNIGVVADAGAESIAASIIKFRDMNRYEYDQYVRNCKKVAEQFDYHNLIDVLIHQIEK